jgi:hypothetical protein
MNRVAVGKAPLTFNAPEHGVFVLSIQHRQEMPWAAHVTVRPGMVARVRVASEHPKRGEAAVRSVEGDPSGDPLTALEFDALKAGIRGSPRSQRRAVLERLCGNAHLVPRQATELVALFGPSEHDRILKWVRPHVVTLKGKEEPLADARR